jgi:hypothetical protein
MDVIFDYSNRFFKGVYNIHVQLLQNESSYIIAMIISYIRLKKNDTEQM